MRLIKPRAYADPEAAAQKLMEIANAVEPVQDGRITGYFDRTKQAPSSSLF